MDDRQHSYSPSALKIFLGYGQDASKEADVIFKLQENLQKSLNKYAGLLKEGFEGYKVVEIWKWQESAIPTVGGQRKIVNPNLDISDVFIFVVRDRIGAVTWDEINRAKKNVKEHAYKKIIVMFPSAPSSIDVINNPAGARGWADLKEKERQLTSDWNKEGSDSITPVQQYESFNELESIVLDQLDRAMRDILRRGCLDENTSLSVQDDAQMMPSEFKEIYGEVEYLDKPCLGAALDDLNWSLVERYAKAIKVYSKDLSKVDLAVRIGIYNPYIDDKRFVTNVAVVAFSDRPRDYIEQALVKFRIDTKNKKYGFYSLSLSIAALAEEVLKVILNELDSGFYDLEGFKRTKQYEIPEEIIRELLSNALVHRDYCSKANITILINDREVEILSPGGSAGQSYLDMLMSGEAFSRPRNPSLKSIAESELIYEGTGKGFKKFNSYMLDRGEDSILWKVVEFEDGEKATRVLLKRPDKKSHFGDVFISYANDSDEHFQNVLKLANDLRTDGVDCQIDQYVNGFPQEGWRFWLNEQVTRSKFIIFVLSSRACDCLKNGCSQEFSMIGLNKKEVLSKLVPVVFEDDALNFNECLPEEIKGKKISYLPRDYVSVHAIKTGV